MPIGGFVISCDPADREVVEKSLDGLPDVEVHGGDDRGNLVCVIESTSSEAMDDLVKSIGRMEEVLSVGLTYLNTEDELDGADPTDIP